MSTTQQLCLLSVIMGQQNKTTKAAHTHTDIHSTQPHRLSRIYAADSHHSYMEKLAVGPGVDPRRISLDYSVAHNLEAIANCLGKPVE